MFSEQKRKLDWKQPTSLEELKAILSSSDPVLIFKHSERCSISRFALNSFENEFENMHNATLVYIEVRQNRELSNYFETDWKIIHQSPQVIAKSKNGAVFTSSHQAISAEEINNHLS